MWDGFQVINSAAPITVRRIPRITLRFGFSLRNATAMAAAKMGVDAPSGAAIFA